ncbi:hypothetical protein HPB50_024186 [Hyalomma asiaticum]|uniref:Uncharacterized protein n=1 Tax=Hyalomma asiaticum TaxID=266040 RepID=A0ACB7SHH6_HYAAI|nr:hypothetical protein HPB50_024186 [Hyalomma asiaticum]
MFTALGLALGRVVVPLAVDKLPLKPSVIAVACLLWLAVPSLAIAHVSTFERVAELAGAVGATQGYTLCMRPLLVADHVGLQRLSLCCGMGGLIGVPCVSLAQQFYEARLLSTQARRNIVAVLGINPTLVEERRHQISHAQRSCIQVSPFPRNVHPRYNVGRRRSRAVALVKHVRNEPHSACFVDAAQYGRSASFVAVVIDHKGLILNSASFKDSTPSKADRRS